jgi:hypothetical protein
VTTAAPPEMAAKSSLASSVSHFTLVRIQEIVVLKTRQAKAHVNLFVLQSTECLQQAIYHLILEKSKQHHFSYCIFALFQPV